MLAFSLKFVQKDKQHGLLVKKEIGLPQGRGLGLQGWPGLRRGWVGLRKAGGSGGGDDGDEPEIDRDPQGCGTDEGSGVEEEE